MNSNKKMSFSVSQEMEEQIISLRKSDEYCRLTVSEILRILIQTGLDQTVAT